MRNTTYTNFGLEAKKVMLEKGITMTALAKEIDISLAYLSDILTGRRKGGNYKEIIAEKLGIEIIKKVS